MGVIHVALVLLLFVLSALLWTDGYVELWRWWKSTRPRGRGRT